MSFSTRLPVAVHILLCIAVFSGRCRTTSNFLAASCGVNPVVVRGLLGRLKEAGLVRVDAGLGGAHLARPAAEVTLLDVFSAVEPREDLFHLHEKPNPLCPVGRNVHAVLNRRLHQLAETMERQLASVTLQDLVLETEARIRSQEAAGEGA